MVMVVEVVVVVVLTRGVDMRPSLKVFFVCNVC